MKRREEKGEAMATVIDMYDVKRKGLEERERWKKKKDEERKSNKKAVHSKKIAGKKKVVSGRSEPTPSREEVRSALTARIHSLYRSITLFLAISGLVDRIVVRARRAGIVVIVYLSPLR